MICTRREKQRLSGKEISLGGDGRWRATNLEDDNFIFPRDLNDINSMIPCESVESSSAVRVDIPFGVESDADEVLGSIEFLEDSLTGVRDPSRV